jgi:predicted permease
MQVDSLRQDVQYALRTLRRDRGFFSIAVLIMALGIGANTAIFSVVNALLFKRLQFTQSDRLVWIANAGGGDGGMSSVTSRVINYLDWKQLNRSFEELAAYFAFFDYGTYNLTGSGEPERLVGVGVSQNFLPFLGVQPALGRNFDEEEAKWNGRRAVILTHGLWERRFGADRAIIGQPVTLNDQLTTIVGVLPPSFDFSAVFTPGSRVDMVVPFPTTPETDRWGNTLAVIGRMKPGVTIEQAQSEFDVLNDQLRKAHPDRWTFGAKLTPLQSHLTGRFQRGLLVLLWAVGAVLLIACTNLSNLQLARAIGRRKEIAIRSAMGATRWRLVRQMLTESLILSAAGGMLGLLLAFIAVRALSRIHDISIPLLRTVELDGTALGFTALIALTTGLLFGIVPAVQMARAKEAEALKDSTRGMSEGRHSSATRGVLVLSQVALACILLVGAGLLIRSFLRVLDVNLGFRPEQTAVWRIETGDKYPNGAARFALYDRLVRRVETIPGVVSAGVTDALPLSRDRSWGLAAKGVTYGKNQYPLGHPRLVDWRYIKTMRIPLIAGRDFDERDGEKSDRVVILNEKAARMLWPGQEAVGKVALINGERRVIGVVGNVRHQALEQEGGNEAYLPLTQASSNSVELVIRTQVPPSSVAAAVRSALREVEPALPTSDYQTLSDLVDRAVSPRRFLVWLLGAFAFTALLLAAIGIYGVVSHSVGQRTQEIGIRMALGASTSQVRGAVMARTVALVGSGVAVGVLGALLLARLASSLLFELEPTDPVTFGATVAVLLGVAIFAGYIPAMRASRVDPMTALRSE